VSLLEVRSVSVTFGGVAALKQVSFALGENEIVGLIGPNGAGKTTLFNCLSGFQVPDEGGMLFGGVRLETRAPHQIAALGIARTFQTSRVFKRMTVLEHVLIGRYGHQRAGLWGAVARPRWVAGEEEAARARGLATLGLFEDRLLGSTTSQTASPTPTAAGWRSPARWSRSRASCCSTSPRRE
jgi:branched-chain amino acid transport system ATP-binding protein